MNRIELMVPFVLLLLLAIESQSAEFRGLGGLLVLRRCPQRRDRDECDLKNQKAACTTYSRALFTTPANATYASPTRKRGDSRFRSLLRLEVSHFQVPEVRHNPCRWREPPDRQESSDSGPGGRHIESVSARWAFGRRTIRHRRFTPPARVLPTLRAWRGENFG